MMDEPMDELNADLGADEATDVPPADAGDAPGADDASGADAAPDADAASDAGEMHADVNTASLRRLVQVPGIGRALARRIIESRPYRDLQDLERVEGLGKKRWEAIAPYLSVSPPGAAVTTAGVPAQRMGVMLPSAEPAETPGEPPKPPPASPPPAGKSAAAARGTGASAPPAADALEKAIVPYAPRQEYATRRFVLLALILGGCLLLILSLLVPLGVLSSLNGGLHYASPSDLAALRADLKGVQDDFSALQNDLSGVRTRLDNLEALSGRLTALESGQETLQAHQDELQAQIEAAQKAVKQAETRVDAMQGQIGEVQDIVDLMKAQVEKFRGFLDGLSKLMGGLKIP